MRTIPGLVAAFGMLQLLLAAPVSLAAVAVFDAGLGTLPQSQGWTFEDFAPTAPPPTIADGALSQGPTSAVDTQWWHRDDVPFTLAAGFAMDVEMQVIASGYATFPDGSQRSGFYVDAVDATGHRITLGISSGGVSVNTDATLQQGNGIPVVSVDNGAGFHHYAVSAAGGTLTLLIDGVARGSAPVGAGLYASTPDTDLVYFGDGTNGAGSTTRVRFVRYGDPAAVLGVAVAPRGSAPALAVHQVAGPPGSVRFAVTGSGSWPVELRIVGVRGALVRRLVGAMPGAGLAEWDGRRSDGQAAAPGVYFVIAAAHADRAGGKLVLLR